MRLIDTSILKTGRPPANGDLDAVMGFALRFPPQRAIAQRFCGVLGMFSSLEVKVLYPT